MQDGVKKVVAEKNDALFLFPRFFKEKHFTLLRALFCPSSNNDYACSVFLQLLMDKEWGMMHVRQCYAVKTSAASSRSFYVTVPRKVDLPVDQATQNHTPSDS